MDGVDVEGGSTDTGGDVGTDLHRDHKDRMAEIANARQEGGDHYKIKSAIPCPHCGMIIEHWDLSWSAKWDMFLYSITKYLFRWKHKNGVQDLKKAAHYLQKYIEVVEKHEGTEPQGRGYVKQE